MEHKSEEACANFQGHGSSLLRNELQLEIKLRHETMKMGEIQNDIKSNPCVNKKLSFSVVRLISFHCCD